LVRVEASCTAVEVSGAVATDSSIKSDCFESEVNFAEAQIHRDGAGTNDETNSEDFYQATSFKKEFPDGETEKKNCSPENVCGPTFPTDVRLKTKVKEDAPGKYRNNPRYFNRIKITEHNNMKIAMFYISTLLCCNENNYIAVNY
jgi:hypothetical protein